MSVPAAADRVAVMVRVVVLSGSIPLPDNATVGGGNGARSKIKSSKYSAVYRPLMTTRSTLSKSLYRTKVTPRSMPAIWYGSRV